MDWFNSTANVTNFCGFEQSGVAESAVWRGSEAQNGTVLFAEFGTFRDANEMESGEFVGRAITGSEFMLSRNGFFGVEVRVVLMSWQQFSNRC
jgi:hypothetical protein